MEQTQLRMGLGVIPETESLDEEEVVGSFSVSGSIHAFAELKKRQTARVTITDENGTIIGKGEGEIGAIGFGFREVDGVPITDRKMKIKV